MYRFNVLFLLSLLFSCSKAESPTPTPPETPRDPVSAVDLSGLPEIEQSGAQYFTGSGFPQDALTQLKNSGVNTIRLRLWVNPANEHSGLQEVKIFSQRIKNAGLKTWITLHYSDTWADPGKQQKPAQWTGIPFNALVDSVKTYTSLVMTALQPDIVQIGNEINAGLLFPEGNINNNYTQFRSLMTAGIEAVRQAAPNAEIMIHYAGISNANWFFNQVKGLDYDLMGISYYPVWHGKDLEEAKTILNNISQAQKKDIILAETAYPFTLEWADWTNNIVGQEDQLILPQYPATADGQKKFMQKIKTMMVDELARGAGFCYWGGELIAWKGNQASDASPWENQALFDFNHKALPVLDAFRVD
ncbi:MAG TPA: glycosyl hydrolase 53 family protein [Saprospiraceae bacterium]|nr:glycosyl hydrolase 53 family protein [Saprospiraceae bacterium]